MRARRTMRAPRAMSTGALTLTMAGAAVALGSISSGALAAQGSRASSATAATPGVAHAARAPRPRHAAPAPRPRGSVAVASRLLVNRDRITTPTGNTVTVHGFLVPGRGGATVKLETPAGRTLATARTRHNGHFGLRYRVQGVGTMPIRVVFGGNRRVRAAAAAAGQIVALAPIVASWYYDSGSTACGFHATYGVANKTLPCGTRVTLSYGGRTVVATVDDRGPYVYGRTFDLNQNTARYLGMWGVGQVFASV
jgi:rare lipoprotein A